jgi:fatty acid desaturase
MSDKLLPFTFKWIGIALVLAGCVFGVICSRYNLRIEVPIFAMVSTFVETKVFTFSRTNFTDELIMILLLPGFLLIVFSKEKKENEQLNTIRTKAFTKAIITNSAFLLLCTLFIYGSSFMVVVLFNLVSVFIFYLCFFYILKWRLKP